MIQRFFLCVCVLILGACGGGSRGTGDLQLSGKILNDSDMPLVDAKVSLISTGDSTTTDAQGDFIIITDSFNGSPAFLIETQGQEIQSQGGEISEDAIEVHVVIRVEVSPSPRATQQVEIRRRRGQSENSGTGNSNDDGSDDNSDDDASGGENSDSQDDDSSSHGNSNDDNDSDDSGNQGSGSSENPGQGSGGGSDDDDSSDDNSSDTRLDTEGVISVLGSDNLQIGGTLFYVDENTTYGSRDSLADFVVGDHVEIRAWKHGERWLAERVRVKN